MNKDIIKGNIFFICSGILLSAIIYLIHYLLFSNFYETLSSIILSLAYVPIGILYQTYIINKILETRERLKSEKKINVIIGSFYHEIGNQLINELIVGDNNIGAMREYFYMDDSWTPLNFERLERLLEDYICDIEFGVVEIGKLALFLDERDDFILRLITNPSLSECDRFNELLMSLLHLRDELQNKYYDNKLNECELDHVKNDLCKTYRYLVIEWVDYIKHLRDYYPFLYQKALRASPFDDRSEEEKDKQYYSMSRDV